MFLLKFVLAATLALSIAPAIASADLFDQRAAEAYRNAQESQERSQAAYAYNMNESIYRLAHAFGAKHGGVSDINIFGNYKARFNSGDGYACEAYVTLTTFQCYEPTGRGMVKFLRNDFVVGTPNSYFDGIYPLAPARKTRRR